MKKSELKINMRVWHPIFLWGTLSHPPREDKSLVAFDFTECSYYMPGRGYSTYKKETGDNVIFLPNDELYPAEIDKELFSRKMKMKIAFLCATVTP